MLAVSPFSSPMHADRPISDITSDDVRPQSVRETQKVHNSEAKAGVIVKKSGDEITSADEFPTSVVTSDGGFRSLKHPEGSDDITTAAGKGSPVMDSAATSDAQGEGKLDEPHGSSLVVKAGAQGQNVAPSGVPQQDCSKIDNGHALGSEVRSNIESQAKDGGVCASALGPLVAKTSSTPSVGSGLVQQAEEGNPSAQVHQQEERCRSGGPQLQQLLPTSEPNGQSKASEMLRQDTAAGQAAAPSDAQSQAQAGGQRPQSQPLALGLTTAAHSPEVVKAGHLSIPQAQLSPEQEGRLQHEPHSQAQQNLQQNQQYPQPNQQAQGMLHQQSGQPQQKAASHAQGQLLPQLPPAPSQHASQVRQQPVPTSVLAPAPTPTTMQASQQANQMQPASQPMNPPQPHQMPTVQHSQPHHMSAMPPVQPQQGQQHQQMQAPQMVHPPQQHAQMGPPQQHQQAMQQPQHPQQPPQMHQQPPHQQMMMQSPRPQMMQVSAQPQHPGSMTPTQQPMQPSQVQHGQYHQVQQQQGMNGYQQPMPNSYMASPPRAMVMQPNTAGMVSPGFAPGDFGSWAPFTTAQWHELEQQAMVFKYLVAGAPVPQELVESMRISLAGSMAGHHGHIISFGQPLWGAAHVDPEPFRCRRTDGKKWRCSREVVPDQKYCERHMHRGRNRARKVSEKSTPGTSLVSGEDHAEMIKSQSQGASEVAGEDPAGAKLDRSESMVGISSAGPPPLALPPAAHTLSGSSHTPQHQQHHHVQQQQHQQPLQPAQQPTQQHHFQGQHAPQHAVAGVPGQHSMQPAQNQQPLQVFSNGGPSATPYQAVQQQQGPSQFQGQYHQSAGQPSAYSSQAPGSDMQQQQPHQQQQQQQQAWLRQGNGPSIHQGGSQVVYVQSANDAHGYQQQPQQMPGGAGGSLGYQQPHSQAQPMTGQGYTQQQQFSAPVGAPVGASASQQQLQAPQQLQQQQQQQPQQLARPGGGSQGATQGSSGSQAGPGLQPGHYQLGQNQPRAPPGPYGTTVQQQPQGGMYPGQTYSQPTAGYSQYAQPLQQQPQLQQPVYGQQMQAYQQPQPAASQYSQQQYAPQPQYQQQPTASYMGHPQQQQQLQQQQSQQQHSNSQPLVRSESQFSSQSSYGGATEPSSQQPQAQPHFYSQASGKQQQHPPQTAQGYLGPTYSVVSQGQVQYQSVGPSQSSDQQYHVQPQQQGPGGPGATGGPGEGKVPLLRVPSIIQASNGSGGPSPPPNQPGQLVRTPSQPQQFGPSAQKALSQSGAHNPSGAPLAPGMHHQQHQHHPQQQNGMQYVGDHAGRDGQATIRWNDGGAGNSFTNMGYHAAGSGQCEPYSQGYPGKIGLGASLKKPGALGAGIDLSSEGNASSISPNCVLQRQHCHSDTSSAESPLGPLSMADNGGPVPKGLSSISTLKGTDSNGVAS